MDQRDRARMTPAEVRPPDPSDIDGDVEINDPEPTRRPRLHRLIAPPMEKRLAPHRLIAACAVAAIVLTVLGWLGVEAVRRLVAYVHAQPVYRLSYRDIVLDPPPPAWYRGGARGFLERFWSSTREPATFSTLDLDKDRLILLLQRSPWVREVSRIEVLTPPRVGVVARLEYRAPVALARFADRTEFAVDREGVLLPMDEVDREALGPFVGLYGFPLPERRYGEVWSHVDPASGLIRREDRLVAAAALAAFVKEHLGQLVGSLPETPGAIVQLVGENGLYVQISSGPRYNVNSLMVFWSNDPRGDLHVGELSDEQKWSMLREWTQQSFPGFQGRPIWLYFTRHGVAVDNRYNVAPALGRNDRRSEDTSQPR